MFIIFFFKKFWILIKMIFSYISYQLTNFFFFFFYNFLFLFLLTLMIFKLGDFEVLLNYLFVLLLSIIIYNVITCFSFKSLLKKFGFEKITRKDYYECGFRPQNQRPIKLPIQFLLICIFFLIYDIELIFLFPYVSGILFLGLFDSILICFFFILFFFSLIIDYERHALYWQY